MGHFWVFGNIEFWIYIHDIGEEYFLHYDYWPAVPMKYHVKKEDQAIDIMFQKEIKRSNENCNKHGHYFYFGTFE